LTLGPLPNNVYILGDTDTGDAVVIDPSYEGQVVLDRAGEKGWMLRGVWLTHGHFDHLAGAGVIANAFTPPLAVSLHPADLAWYENDGGAAKFGMAIPALPEIDLYFEDRMQLGLHPGQAPVVEVRHAPGHSAGHVMFYIESLGALVCGDVIFRQGIGRTDLEDGDLLTLLDSIRTQVLTLPDETRLLPGHGPGSTVGYERTHNPFL
jgi:hydroxyacylglutathione hydrolase